MLSALPEDYSSVPRTHNQCLTTMFSPDPKDGMTLTSKNTFILDTLSRMIER